MQGGKKVTAKFGKLIVCLESKLISDSDLLYLNKSHVPAATQTAKNNL